jgi:hypothetical protein
MQVDWSAILAFIAERDPDIAASCVGVPRSHVEAVERQCGISLPANYVNFLEVMGERSGGLHLFGFVRDHRFSHLVSQLPSTFYPMQQYFRVAAEVDMSAPSFEDVFIDLSRSDGNDGALVRFELPWSLDSEVEEEPLSVTEKPIYEIAWQVDVAPKPFGAKLLLFEGGPSGDPQRTKHDASNILRRIGFVTILPDLPRVSCVAHGPISILISIDEELVAFEFGGDNRETVETPVAALLAAFPGAVLQEAPSRRPDSGT